VLVGSVREQFHEDAPTHRNTDRTEKGRSQVLAIDILKWPGMNVAFLTALIVTLGLTFAVIPFGKRRPIGKPISWGEAMLGSAYVFLVLFLAYGVVPNQWLLHVQNGLGWRADKIVLGPGQILKAQSTCNPECGQFPFTINYLQVGDAIVTMIYIAFLGLQIYMFSWWQKRGKKAPSTEVETSTYGRPLVKKA
jgi:hypothetical protein